MSIVEELELDITGALDAIESLNQPLTELGTNLTESLNTAIESVDVQPLVDQLAALDASGLTTTIDAAVEAADGIVPIEADTEQVPGEIDAAVDSADGTVVIEADASAVPDEIGSSIDAADTSVLIEPDVGDIASEIEAEIQGADTTITLEVDSSGLEEVSGDLGGLTGSVEGTTDAFGGLEGSVAALAGGDALGGLTSQLGKAGPIGTAAAAGIGAATAGVFALVNAGTEALASQQRFNQTFGELADAASRVKLGDLNADLGELAIKLGSDDEALQDAASSIFQFGQAAGFTSEQSLELVNNSAALAARAVALNPALGQVGDVAANISNAFSRGGKFAAKYGLSLTAAEIQARALANTGKTTTAELTIQDKAFAGSQIAAERYGDGLEKTINKGSKNAAIQQRSLTEQLQNFIEEAGKPLVAPFQEILRELLPVVKELLPIFSELAQAVLPVVAQVIKDNLPVIKLFAQLFKELSPIITPLIRVSLLLLNPLSGIARAFDGINASGAGVSDLFSGIGDAISGFLGDVVGFGSDIIDSFLTGIQEAFPAVVAFFASVGTTIFDTIGDVTTTILQKGTDLITGLLSGITTAVVAVFDFFRNLATTIFTTIGDVVGTLVQKGTDFIQGLLSGIVQKAEEVFSFVREIPGRIVRGLGNLGDILFDAGKRIISGLIEGMFKQLGPLGKFLGGVGKFIVDKKPIATDHLLLRPAGEAIIQGLADSMEDTLPAVEQALDGITSTIADTKVPGPEFVPATLPIPGVSGVSALPAVAAALPSAGAATATAGQTAGAAGPLGATGSGDIQIIVQTTSPNPVDVGFEVVRQLQAATYRTQR